MSWREKAGKGKRMGITLLAALTLLFTFTSCDSTIYDDEGDCEVTYRLKFRYDYNMKFADAFANEVKSVSVYAFDKTTGKLVWQKTDKGSTLAQDGYTMELDLEPGDYDLIAWCGLDNDTTDESFTVPQMTVGTSTKDDLTCKISRKHDTDGTAYVANDLYGLYHGALSVNLPQNDDGGDYLYTMSLTKDTNHLRVILQHLSGEDVDVSKFTFSLEDENGLMNYDNSLLSDEAITYRAWNTESGKAGVETKAGSRAITQVSVAIADLTTARLIDGRKMYLTIRNDQDEVVARVPFIDYALLIKGNYNREMSDQEFLDRQDEWSMTFFLDDNDNWMSAYIDILSWRVVLNNAELQS